MAEVAVLGMGRMGAAMAVRFADAGHRVTIWNRTRARADAVAATRDASDIRVAGDAAVAVRDRDLVVSMLADGTSTCEVLLDGAVLDALGSGTVVCDMATSGVQSVDRCAAAITARGARFLDAPVSGSVPAVQAGTLLVMAGGDEAVVERARLLLGAIADRVVRVGDVGAGQAMKLAVNLVVHNLNAALSESLQLAERSGISRETAYDVLMQSVVAAPFVRYKRQAFLDRDAPVAMSLALVRKDLDLITQAARAAGASSEVTSSVLDVVGRACAAGFGAADMAALSRVDVVSDGRPDATVKSH
ncbi:MAG: NAD(P)-dependent oxidoreductase [Jatrophihabitans sp.]|uniref:NAD(P)-dependent oxidoreductase n=1 Tax=Jatrophihabitans sp. TaxID=1932789 RepID=UPI003F7F8B07